MPTDSRNRSAGTGVPGAFDAGAMLDQALHAAQRRGALPQFDMRGRGDGGGFARCADAVDSANANRHHAAEAAAHLLGGGRMAGKRRQSRIEHFANSADAARSARRWPARWRTPCARAERACACRASAATPRTARARRPTARARRLMRCHSAESSRVVSVPAITSEWPFRYFVAECMTMSAPSSSGRVSTGVAAVESTATAAPAACAISQAGGDVGDRPQRIGRRFDPDESRAPGLQRARAARRCRSCR